MKITEITENRILFDDGGEIVISPAEVKIAMTGDEKQSAKTKEIKYAAFKEETDGFSFGEILGTRVRVRIKSGSNTWCSVRYNGELKIELAVC